MAENITGGKRLSELINSLKCVGDPFFVLTDDLLNRFYVDPYESNFTQSQLEHNDTIILIGKKGTGKSTLISRYRNQMKKSRDTLVVYLDTKSLFRFPVALDEENQSFLNDYQFFQTFLDKMFEAIFEGLDQQEALNFNTKREIRHLYSNLKVTEEIFRKDDSTVTNMKKILDKKKINGILGLTIKKLNTGLGGMKEKQVVNEFQENYTKRIIEFYNPIENMNLLRKVLMKNSIKKVNICFDDFSEISYDSMELLVNLFISGLHYDANNFYKFIICAYPGRLYLGTKDAGIGVAGITTLNLDFFELTKNMNTGEAIASSVRKISELLDKRFEYYFDGQLCFNDLVEPEEDLNFYHKLLFTYTFNNPRAIGKILNILNRDYISRNKLITTRSITDASIEYYMAVRDDFFKKGLSKYYSFNEDLSVFNLKQIYDLLMNKAVENYQSGFFRSKKLYANIFYIEKKYERYLQSFELCNLVFKLREVEFKDKNYSFFTLNSALCNKEGIKVKIEISQYKNYLNNPETSNYTHLLVEYLYNLKEFVCNVCNDIQPFSKEEILEQINFKCIRGDCVGKYSLKERNLG